ncbi:hypothetical protein B0T18DRAFT_193174 [Schizothecium vesticola]|uniref:Uncharacterized protein n=1 Tax=Schizothecium vesticola TaxID=314040 RepID=A0AA40K2W7_9PEZI|nr:hypothetical protein B0T18DRAFT_193174 [Schizothecium vesticola]
MGNWAIGNGYHCHTTPWPSPSRRTEKKKPRRSFWHLPSVAGLTLSRRTVHLVCLAHLDLSGPSPPPPPRPLPLRLLLSPTRTVAWAQRAHLQKTPPRNPLPRSSSSQVPSLPRTPSSLERSGVSNHGDSTASRGGHPQTWHRLPSAQRQSRYSGALGQPQPRATVEWFDKHGIVVLRPPKHSNRHIYHGRVIARGLTYSTRAEGWVCTCGRRGPIWRTEGACQTRPTDRRSGDRGRCRLRAPRCAARLALKRRRGRGQQVRGTTTEKEEARLACQPIRPAPESPRPTPTRKVKQCAATSSSHDA